MKQTSLIRNTCLLATLLLSTTALNAAVITLNNGDFQGGDTGTGDFDPAGWSVAEQTGGDIYAFTGGGAFTGTKLLHIKDNSGSTTPAIFQNLTSSNVGLTVGSYSNYTLTLDLGWRTDRLQNSPFTGTGDATLRFELYDVATPTTVYGFTDFTLVQRATPLFDSYALIHDNMTINIANSGSGAGNIGLRILRTDPDNTSNQGESTLWMDNLSMTAIPEPSAALLGGLGMLVLLRRRRF